MFDTVRELVDRWLGLGLPASELHFTHMACRTVVVFGFGVIIARLADRRLLGHTAGFDIVVMVILGSVLSRGINGQAAFFPSLGASALLILLHHVLATAAFHWHWFSDLTKGQPRTLVRDGKIDRREAARSKITDEDLHENLRLNGNLAEVSDVAEARLERNGSVSVVKKKD